MINVVIGLLSKVRPGWLVALSVAGIMGYKIVVLNKSIDELNSTIKVVNTELAKEKANKYLAIAERDSLMLVIDETNTKITAMEVNNTKLLDELAEWESKPAKIKYKVLYKNVYKYLPNNTDPLKAGDCEAGRLLNQGIVGVKYEDL